MKKFIKDVPQVTTQDAQQRKYAKTEKAAVKKTPTRASGSVVC
jgi:hypothetical protein